MSSIFVFKETPTAEIYTLSLHDALPIWATARLRQAANAWGAAPLRTWQRGCAPSVDRKSTRLNSSHQIISYAVFCLKKKKRAVHQEERRAEMNHTLQENRCETSLAKPMR